MQEDLRHSDGKSWWSCIGRDFERVIDIGSVCRFAAPFDICSEQSLLINRQKAFYSCGHCQLSFLPNSLLPPARSKIGAVTIEHAPVRCLVFKRRPIVRRVRPPIPIWKCIRIDEAVFLFLTKRARCARHQNNPERQAPNDPAEHRAATFAHALVQRYENFAISSVSPRCRLCLRA
jgi:hypothetical protein